MMGFVFGTVCLLLLVRMAAHGAWARCHMAHGNSGGCGRGWHGGRGSHNGWEVPGGQGGSGGGRVDAERMGRAAGEVMKRRLGIDGEQEGVVDHALIDLRGALKELAGELKETKQPLVDAFAGETVDDSGLAAIFARQDDAVARARREVLSSLKQIHAVLRPDQRERAVKWLGSLGPSASDGKGGKGRDGNVGGWF